MSGEDILPHCKPLGAHVVDVNRTWRFFLPEIEAIRPERAHRVVTDRTDAAVQCALTDAERVCYRCE